MSETKPPTIDRKDPLWGMFASAIARARLVGHQLTRDDVELAPIMCADFADAMIRERDRRDRDERDEPLSQEEWDELYKGKVR